MSRIDRRQVARLLIALGATFAVVVTWPYYSVIDLVASSSGFDEINARTYRSIASRTFLAIPGLMILLTARPRPAKVGWAYAATIVGAVYVGGALTDRAAFGRVMPGLMLVLHLAMGDWFASAIETRPQFMRRVAVLGLTAIVLVGLAGTATGWLRGVPRALVRLDGGPTPTRVED